MKHTSTSPRGMAMFGGLPDRNCLLMTTSCGNASNSRYKTNALQLSPQWSRTQQKALDNNDGDDVASQEKSTFRSKTMYTESRHSYNILKSKCLTLILRRSRTGTIWFYTSTSNKRAARPKLYTKSLTRDLKLMYSRLTLVRISIKL